jgi:hypothetical protein
MLNAGMAFFLDTMSSLRAKTVGIKNNSVIVGIALLSGLLGQRQTAYRSTG